MEHINKVFIEVCVLQIGLENFINDNASEKSRYTSIRKTNQQWLYTKIIVVFVKTVWKTSVPCGENAEFWFKPTQSTVYKVIP
jgi:hypothetical protein